MCKADDVRRLNNDEVPTIVFACSVNHAKMLSAMLTIEGISNSLVIGELDPVSRKKAIDSFKDKTNKVNIIINYEVLTTGFDSKNIRCVFITLPADVDNDSAIAQAEAVPAVAALMEGKTVVKAIYVKGRLVNLVVK